MKKTVVAILTTLLASMCLVMIGHSLGYGGVRAEAQVYVSEEQSTDVEDEDLLSHYDGDDKAYLRFLSDYFFAKYRDNPQIAPDYIGREMARMLNEVKNDMASHPYLRGEISEETGEITILGVKFAGFSGETMPEPEYYDPAYTFYYAGITNVPDTLVIPDAFEGHPVTAIAGGAFDAEMGYSPTFRSVVIGDNVRTVGDYAFHYQIHMQSVTFGENVQTIGDWAFESCVKLHEITSWGSHLKTIGYCAFERWTWAGNVSLLFPPFPDTLESIEAFAFEAVILPQTIVLPPSVQSISNAAFDECTSLRLVILNNSISISPWHIAHTSLHPEGIPHGFFLDYYWPDCCLYCYAGSTAEAYAKESCDPYQLIDGDSLLWDGEAVEGNGLKIKEGMSEAELRLHLSIDGTSSEIRIDGLENGKVVNGTTVTLFHTIAQAPGKVYTVATIKEPEIVSVAVETTPKTSYAYKEAFDPTGLSLRVTYDNGDETVVTDNITCTGTDLKVGTNTITATYENVSTTFAVTVRYTWWQQLIRIFLFGFLWY